MTAEEDYPRQLKALRISGTVLVLSLGLPALGLPVKIRALNTLFQNLAPGGTDAMPLLTKILIHNETPLMWLISLVIMATLLGVRMSKRLSTLIYLIGAAMAFFSFLGALIDLSIHQPFGSVLVKF